MISYDISVVVCRVALVELMHMIKISFTDKVFNINTVFLKPELSLRKEEESILP